MVLSIFINHPLARKNNFRNCGRKGRCPINTLLGIGILYALVKTVTDHVATAATGFAVACEEIKDGEYKKAALFMAGGFLAPIHHTSQVVSLAGKQVIMSAKYCCGYSKETTLSPTNEQIESEIEEQVANNQYLSAHTTN